MKTDRQLIEKLLEMQEHPEQVTDEQLQQALEDPQMRELVEQMAFAKRAFKNKESLSEELPIEDEWEKFTASRAEELDALDEGKAQPHSSLFILRSSLHKFAASFIGILLISGIALAAIHTWSLTTAPSPRDEEHSYTQASDTSRKSSPIPSEGEEETTVIFDNVPLDTMLLEIAAYYHVSVEIEREEVRQLRFHFVWKRTDDLDHLVKKLNNFEAVNIIREPQKLIVK
jgi:hypothetical protein